MSRASGLELAAAAGVDDQTLGLDAAALHAWGRRLRGRVILPGHDEYDSARQVWNRAIDRKPAAIVRCAGEDDVVRTVELARTHGALLAVRSGGHSQPGHSVCTGGILLDLGGLDDVRVDMSAHVVSASAGARVSRLLEVLQPYGVVTTTGGCPDVGLGGLTLGGGENLLMARYGAVCDNVISARLVTADGRVLTVSRDEHPDLFWAIRGGGGNFGVVTSFEYRVYPLARVLCGQLFFPLKRAREVLRRYRDLMEGAPDELQTSGGMISLDDLPMLFLAFCHCGDRPAAEQFLAWWQAQLKPIRDNISDKAFAAEFTMPSAPSAGTGAFLPQLSDQVIDDLAECFADPPPLSMAVWNDYHGAVTRVPSDDAAFPFRYSGFDLFVMAAWEQPGGQQHARSWVAELETRLRPHTRGVYVNNLEDEGAARVREAYGRSYDRLAEIKARYDPENLFRLNQNIPPVVRGSGVI